MSYNKEYQRQYYLEHREKKIEATRRWREQNPEREKERTRQWSIDNPEKRRSILARFYEKHDHCALVNAWRKANPEKARANARKYVIHRRARLRGAKGNFDYQKWLQRCAFYGWRCVYCRIILTESTVTVDHRIPLSRGGSNWLSNLVPACKSCNCKKGARPSHA